MESELHNLKWDNHSWIVMTRLANLYRREMLIDCTMCVEGEMIHAHKNLLAAVSPYFERLFSEQPHKKCFDFYNFKHKDVKAVINFLYYGFVKLPPPDMQTFLEAAEKFQIQVACESTWVSRGEDLERRPSPMGNGEQGYSHEDDWNSLIGESRIKQEPPEDDISELSSVVVTNNGRTKEKTGADERISHLPGHAEAHKFLSHVRGAPESRGVSQLPSGDAAFNSSPDNRRGGTKGENSLPLISPSRKKSPSDRHSGQFPSSKNVVSNSTRDKQETGERDADDIILIPKNSSLNRLGKSQPPSRNLVSHASRDSTQTGRKAENTLALASPTPKKPPTNRQSTSRSPNRNFATVSHKDNQEISRKRENSQSRTSSTPKKSPLDRRSRSRTPIKNLDSKKESKKDARRTGAENSLESPTNKRSKLNCSSGSPSPSRNVSSNSQEENQQIRRKRENSRSLRSPTPKKSPSKLSTRSRSPSRKVESNSSTDTPVRGRKSKSTRSMDDTTNSTKTPTAKRGRISRSSATKLAPNSPKAKLPDRVKNDEREPYEEDIEIKEIAGEDKRRETKSRYREKRVVSDKRKCVHCGKSFSYFKSLCVHLRTHNVFPCSVCELSFDSLSAFEEHSTDCFYRCEICGKSLKQKFHLQEHMRLHSGDKPYSCEKCGKRFPTNSAFKTHSRVHSGEKPYHCEICGKNFNQRCSLKQHLRTHINMRPFECEYCGKGYNDKSNLRRHLDGHTGEKLFHCDVCQASFSTKASLRRHMYCHMDDKPFSCEECDRTFTQLVHLQYHMHTHTGERPYRCKTCGRTYLQSSHLKQHELSHKNKASK